MYKIAILVLLVWISLSTSLDVEATGVTKSKPKAEMVSTDLKFSGDFRIRWQGDLQSNEDLRDLKSAYQFRLRLSATNRINQYLDFGSRFVSGNPALMASGGDQAFSDFFIRKTISIDQIYMRYKPERRFEFLAGKFANPFLKTELVWDEDVPFEGLSQSIHLSDQKLPNSLSLKLGEFLLDKSGSEAGSYLLGFQVATRVGLTPPTTLTVAASMYDFINEDRIYISRKEGVLKPTIKDIKAETNRSNLGQSGYLSEFRVVDLIGKISYLVDKYPVELVVDYAQNIEAEDENRGFWTIVSLGDLKSVGNIKASYNFFLIQADAVVAAYNNFDFADTNVVGHGFVITYQPLKNTFLDLVAFFRKTNSAPEGQPTPLRTRARLQLSVTF